jgi:hypothetical protein
VIETLESESVDKRNCYKLNVALPAVVTHACDPSTEAAEAGETLELRKSQLKQYSKTPISTFLPPEKVALKHVG